MTLDRFLVYGELYRRVRDSLAGALLSENLDELIASLEVYSACPLSHRFERSQIVVFLVVHKLYILLLLLFPRILYSKEIKV